MTYVLASMHNKVKWYVFDISAPEKGFELIDILDLNRVPRAGNKTTAKLWAKALGLSSYRYVRF
jgi:hypothetical protein